MSLRNSVLLILLATVCAAQGVPQSQLSCDQQRIVVTVTDHDGAPLTGLTLANFRGEVHGKPIKIVSAIPKSNPAMVVFLDASPSMTEPLHSSPWFTAVRAATAVVESATPDTPVAMVVFTAAPVAAEQGRAAVLDALKGFQTRVPQFKQADERRTAITDTIAAVMDKG